MGSVSSRHRTHVPATWAGGEYFEQPSVDSSDEALSRLPTKLAAVQAEIVHHQPLRHTPAIRRPHLASLLHLDKPSHAAQPADTLVVYVFSSTDPSYEDNFRFFLNHGIQDGDGCDYVFVIQQVWCLGETQQSHHTP
jgi:hypothetical protein